MNLIIKLDKKSRDIELILKEGNKVIDRFILTADHNLDTLLIESIDKILKKNRIDSTRLKKAIIEGELDKTSSTHRIIRVCAKALNL